MESPLQPYAIGIVGEDAWTKGEISARDAYLIVRTFKAARIAKVHRMGRRGHRRWKLVPRNTQEWRQPSA